MRNILFVCIHNSARSQMAEAFLNRLGEGKFISESAGIEAGNLNPLVVKAMAEIGYDLSQNKTKSVFDFHKQGKTYWSVIKVCDQANGERCPIFPGTVNNFNWNLPDPSALQGTEEEKMVEIRKIRDQVKLKVEEFIRDYESV